MFGFSKVPPRILGQVSVELNSKKEQVFSLIGELQEVQEYGGTLTSYIVLKGGDSGDRGFDQWSLIMQGGSGTDEQNSWNSGYGQLGLGALT